MVNILLLWEKPIWIQTSLNAKTAGNRDIPYLCTKYIGPNVKNTIDLTNSNTTEIWHGAPKPTSRPTFYDLKLQKKNHILTYSNVSTVKVIIKLIVLTVCFGSIDLIGNSTARRYKSFEKLELTQFTYFWVEINNDSEISQLFFAEHLQEQASH